MTTFKCCVAVIQLPSLSFATLAVTDPILPGSAAYTAPDGTIANAETAASTSAAVLLKKLGIFICFLLFC